MRSDTDRERSYRAKTLMALALLSAGTWFVLWRPRSTREELASPPLSDPASEQHARIRTKSAEALLVMDEDAGRQQHEGVRNAIAGDETSVLNCRQATDGEALAGVHLYLENEPIAGPSDARGELEVDATGRGPLTLWVAGWLPVSVQAEALPDTVLFEVAGATLELYLSGASSQHRLLRSVLQPHAPTPPHGPWAASFEERSVDTWVAEGVVPGRYDLYLWVTYPDGEPRPSSQRSVEVGADGPTRVTIDLSSPRSPEEAESDS